MFCRFFLLYNHQKDELKVDWWVYMLSKLAEYPHLDFHFLSCLLMIRVQQKSLR